MSDADKWIRRAAARCHDCVSSHDLCAHPPMLTIHMYLAYLDKDNPKGNLLAVKAYLLTQNLFKTRLWLWTDDPSKIINPSTQEFFDTFSDVVSVKKFVWDDEVEQTPLAGHPYFGNHFLVRSDFEDFLAGYGDLVRHMLLYNHGGLWIDTDVVLLRDVYPVTMQVITQHLCMHYPPSLHVVVMASKQATQSRHHCIWSAEHIHIQGVVCKCKPCLLLVHMISSKK